MSTESTIRSYVAQRIKEMRENYGSAKLSQEALAAKMGVATNTLSRWETGTYEPTLEDLDSLARHLGASILDFFPATRSEDKKSESVDALLRTAKSLDERDLEELRRYAEFRKARQMYKRKTSGRPPKK
jgi:transcriptional regulator with XRE-family HTH domain